MPAPQPRQPSSKTVIDTRPRLTSHPAYRPLKQQPQQTKRPGQEQLERGSCSGTTTLPSLQSQGHRRGYRVPHRLQTVMLRGRKTLSPRGAVQHQKESPGPPPDHEAMQEVALNKHLPAGTGDLGGFQAPLLATTGCKVNAWSAEYWLPRPGSPMGVGCASQRAGTQHHFHPCHETGRVREPRAAAEGTRGEVASQQASEQLSRKKLPSWERS